MPDVLGRLRRALKPVACSDASCKRGEGDEFRDGRWFNDYTEEALEQLLEPIGGRQVRRLWSTADVRAGREVRRRRMRGGVAGRDVRRAAPGGGSCLTCAPAVLLCLPPPPPTCAQADDAKGEEGEGGGFGDGCRHGLHRGEPEGVAGFGVRSDGKRGHTAGSRCSATVEFVAAPVEIEETRLSYELLRQVQRRRENPDPVCHRCQPERPVPSRRADNSK
jgi:hypothetical protein